MTIETAAMHIGGRVAYVPHGQETAELGEIMRVNGAYAFVRFDTHQDSKACSPADLRLVVQR